jgi:hypothetical protein
VKVDPFRVAKLHLVDDDLRFGGAPENMQKAGKNDDQTQ